MATFRSLPISTWLFAALVSSFITELAAQPTPADDGPCCHSRSIYVPIATYIVDVGLPLALLLTAAIIFRLKRAKEAAFAAEISVPSPASCIARSSAFAAIEVQDLNYDCPQERSGWGASLARFTLHKSIMQRSVQAAKTATQVEHTLGQQASAPVLALLSALFTVPTGLTSEQGSTRLHTYGDNVVEQSKPLSTLVLIYRSVFEPFNGLMLIVAILTACPPNSSYPTTVLIMVLLLAAIGIRFCEELKSRKLTKAMVTAVTSSAKVLRNGAEVLVDIKEVVPGDIVMLSAGDLIPGDVRILEQHNLFISMSGLTGEAMPVERHAGLSSPKETAVHHENICLMSTFVVSGSGKAVVLATGDGTYVASLMRQLPSGHVMNAFDYAVRRIVYLFIGFILVMVPLVIVLNGTTTSDWNGAMTFGLAVAVGLTPQMLPMIVTTNLARGVRIMRTKKIAIRRMDAVQNLGAMDILCTDKTGTLTIDEVALLKALDPTGKEDLDILKLAYANSRFQEGLPNLLDKGVLHAGHKRGFYQAVEKEWVYMDEIPFDFERRLLSVVLRPAADAQAHPTLICKGALEELLAACDHVYEAGEVIKLDDQRRLAILNCGHDLNDDGLRVVGLATKTFIKPLGALRVDPTDESRMLFRGFLAFVDPLKLSAIPCIKELYSRGVAIKVLTGDSLRVAKRICKDVGIENVHCATGADLLAAEKDELSDMIERCTVFAKVTPQQKMAIVAGLQKNSHIVGFLGDGTNDALALCKADVGVSVDSGTDTAKMAADMVMLDKDLDSICKGVLIGRMTYGNTIKYIKFASSSSFGNMFSILAAAIWLPFTPLQAVQVLVLNVLYNISQFAIPWDTMDPMFLEKPKRWSAKFLGLYMFIIGPVSSIFDMTTFLIMWYVYHCWNADNDKVQLFQTAWFLESLMTQTFIVHLLRTERMPFFQSRAAWPLMLSSFGTMVAGIVICYIPGLNTAIGIIPVIPSYYVWMIGTTFLYCVAVQIYKNIYIKVFNSWL
ncbi:g479 [Coccomyxa elongata]